MLYVWNNACGHTPFPIVIACQYLRLASRGRGFDPLFPFPSLLSPPHTQLRRVHWAAVFRSSFMVLFLAYPGVSLKVLRVFKCREVGGKYWLVADMRLQCFTGQWAGYAAYALLVCVVYVVGLPLGTYSSSVALCCIHCKNK